MEPISKNYLEGEERVHGYYSSSSWVEVASLVHGMNEECNKGGHKDEINQQNVGFSNKNLCSMFI
jgi:hypothetical protein